jgi:tRNA threonylcarbamoyl adenosine modification protein YeaZ
MFLIIDTSDNEKIFIALFKREKIISQKTISAKYKQAEKLLPTVKGLLEKNGVGLKILKGIIVVKGPGAFTALRVGVVTANTLGFALGIPIVGIRDDLKQSKRSHNLSELIKGGIKKLRKAKKGKIVRPFYE